MGITARGIGLLVAALVLLGVGFRYAYPELTVLGAAAGVAVGYAVVNAAWRPRLNVARRADPDRVARGEPAAMELTVRNTGRLRAANLVAEDRCAGALVPVPLLRLRPGRDTVVRYDVPTHRRGVVPVGPLRVVRRDPLGLVALARGYGGTVPVWVHPRIHPLSAVPTGAGRSLDGRTDSVPHGSITFDSLREYVVGDELRRVHWRTSARVGELMVRENVDTSLPRLVVVLDNRASAHPGRVGGVAESFESACEAAASVVAAAVREDLPVQLLFVVPGEVEPEGAAGPLDRLAAVELADAGPDVLPAATGRLRRDRLGDTLVFLTGPGGRDELGHVGALRGAYPSVVVGVFGADGPTAAGATGLTVLDAADGAAFAAEWDGVRRW
ncbi:MULTISPECIES: DUF58 domain-containing protein [unclassified Micromonospora]|uniref:DUF58 domain-containing protein n=1 Tax=unclassified Micromonospora TaxID=2617518 RepID=UPI0003EEA85C|nr:MULTISPECIES: DUF58 domain-containing protein [unclassified Micromonospora]EWM68855.1 hypothetical protein MCBG_05989 [Micromonospora sp. M42]MCK1804968.1 DUF58 domain-containing protein [Micromonospora sp. R42106]MCK1834696.1 DUF58 domain-containing protein [Micromonospora sp. R42003]MCK1846589.1 DUF58 domain-containing protein [Micromonospora sp. R42004]MCM1018865.1 DUF58 domain-containing protein [Micromonospora sp. XM-20-01]